MVSLGIGVAQVLSPLPRVPGPQHHGLQHGRPYDHVGVLAVPLVLGPWAEHVQLLAVPVQETRISDQSPGPASLINRIDR